MQTQQRKEVPIEAIHLLRAAHSLRRIARSAERRRDEALTMRDKQRGELRAAYLTRDVEAYTFAARYVEEAARRLAEHSQ